MLIRQRRFRLNASPVTERAATVRRSLEIGVVYAFPTASTNVSALQVTSPHTEPIGADAPR